MDIRFGDFSQMKINGYLSATATLGLPPNAYAAVSARAAGRPACIFAVAVRRCERGVEIAAEEDWNIQVFGADGFRRRRISAQADFGASGSRRM